MMMKIKKKYNKPKLRVIKLASEEVLSNGCNKIDGSSFNQDMPFTCKIGGGGSCHQTPNLS